MSYLPVRYRTNSKYDYIYDKYLNIDKISFIGFKQVDIKGVPHYYIVFQADQDVYDLVQEGHTETLLFGSMKLAKQYLIEQDILKEVNGK